MGFQFVHLETFSRKADGKGRSVGYVLDEAERLPEACQHVEHPRPPEVVYGVSLGELRELHNRRVAEAVATTRAGRSRRIRSDQHTLATVVASHPGGTPEEVARWERLTVRWLRELYGTALVSVVRHTDEAYPHLHVYLLPGGDMKARSLHPGVGAKAAAMAAPVSGDTPAATNATGDRAYRAAMRAWQHSYWERVGLPCGLTRLGPGRRRLTRAGWQAEQSAAAAAAESLRVLEEAEAATSAVQAKALDLGDRGRAFVAKARKAASDAKAAADAAEVSRRETEEAEARILRRIGSVTDLVEELQGIRVELVRERTARQVAERDRERYRGMWAEADNRVQDLERGYQR